MANIIAYKNKKDAIITYRVRVSLGYDLNGIQVQKTTTFKLPPNTTASKGKKMAEQFALEFEQKCQGYSMLNETMRFSELAEWYFKNYAPVELKESSIYNYKSQYENHLAPIIGNTKLKDITTPRLTELMQNYDLNPNTVKKIYVIIQSIFHRGVDQGFIRESPCHNVILPKHKYKKKKLVLDEEQTQRFLSLLNNKPWDEDFKRNIKVLLYTGMRCGECLALSWVDLDFENKVISINHNLADVAGKHYLTTPKTQSSIRVIGMSDALAEIFKEQKAFQEKVGEYIDDFAHPEMVFTSSLGNYKDRSALNTSFKRFLKGTEFEFLTLHSLRHCNATLLLISGVDLKVVSEHLGHCDIGVTANVYADVLKSTKMKVAELVSLKLA